METVNHQALNTLLKANSKDIVIRLCNEAFLHRNRKTIQGEVYKKAAEALTIDEIESQKLLTALSGLIKNALFVSSTKPAVIATLFPEDFHKNLRDLLGRILIENIPNWKAHSINNLVSLPRLIDFDWRVDIKTSSDTMARMSVPTCILQMQVQDCATEVSKMPPVSTVNVELSKETLDTMLDGLGKIRDQLSSVANK